VFVFLTVFVVIASLTARPVLAGGGKDTAKDEAAMHKNAEAFVEAFQKGDAKAVAAFWTEDGEYTDKTGRKLKGRKAIEKAFTNFFKENKDLKARINITSLKFVTPDVALEEGITEVITSDGAPPSRARYTIVHVKKDGQWHLSSVRDSPYTPPTNYRYLKGLEWVIGDWADETDKGETAHIAFSWGPSQNFIISTFATTFKNISMASGTQWIGWDPVEKHIRSFTFDADGGFAEGNWKKDGKKWIIKTNTVLPSGKKVVATNIVTRIDADTISWQSTERSVDGKALPDIAEVRMKRVK
jgi:uncharacterized protein (TIGR02246 family)